MNDMPQHPADHVAAPAAGDASVLEDLQQKIAIARDLGRVGFWERSLQGDAVVWDAQVYAAFGLAPGEPPPTRVQLLQRIHPDDRVQYEHVWHTSIATRKHSSLSYRILLPDGGQRVVQTIWRVVRDPVRGWCAKGILLDTTEAYELAREVHSLHHELHVTQSILGAGIVRMELDSGRCFLDQRAAEIHGLSYSPHPLTLEQVRAFVLPEDRADAVATTDRALQEPGTFETTSRIRRPDGSIRNVLTRRYCERDESGRPLRLFAVLLDTTDALARERESRVLADWMELAIEAGGVGLWQWDIVHDRTSWNETTRVLFGLKPDERECETLFWERLHPDDRDRLAAQESLAFSSNVATLDSQFRVLRPDGTVAHVLNRAKIERDADGRATRLIGINADMTERVRAEQALRTAQERMQLATSATGIGIWEHDLIADRSTWDARVREIYDIAPEVAITRATWRRTLHPDDVSRAIRAKELALLDDGRFECEFRIITSKGEVRHVVERGVISNGADGKPARIVGIAIDITRERTALAVARETSERLALAAEAAGIGSWENDLRTNTIVWDAQMFRLFGYAQAPTGSIYRLWRDALHPDDSDRVLAQARICAELGHDFDGEYRIVWPDGRVRTVAARGVIHDMPDLGERKMVGVLWDVTEQRRVEAAWREKEAAERASRAKTEFLSRMSHELRTPLNAILGFAQLLALDAGPALDAPNRARLARIESAGNHLLQLVGEVLELSRIESGKLNLSIEPVDVRSVLVDAVETVQPLAAELDVRVMLELNGTLYVRADRVRLRQVLINLASNAVKYNRPCGEARLGAYLDAQGEALIYVRDTGIGMSEEQLAHAFEPFDRLGRDGAAIEGTGLGLPIARDLSIQMGGRLDVSSRPGEGTEFRLTLARAEPPSAEGTAAAGVAHGVSTAAGARARHDVTGTIVYIEDNPSNTQLVEQYLALRPHVDLWCAPDGMSGLALVRVTQPDLILLDMRLPDIDGFMVHERLRGLALAGEWCAAPCIALSANAMPDEIERARALGFTDYWTKPLDLAHFLTGVDALLGVYGEPE